VIGSGATAVTLVPELAKRAAHVTMLQRSPSYIVSVPATDKLAKYLPRGAARWKNVLLGMAFYQFSRRYPERAKQLLLKQVKRQLPIGYDLAHFTPSYMPWDQRVCLVPNADLFKQVRAGKVSVVTDHIETFTEHGIQLRSGQTLDADVVVTATGLRVKFLAGMRVTVDGAPLDPASQLVYKGMMLSSVPNLAFAIGYPNASWTLKCDLVSRYVCRLLNHMRDHKLSTCTAHRDPDVEEQPMLDFTSGYIERARNVLPRQGNKVPWRLHHNYALDLATLRHSRIDDRAMRFS
jgi:cation diffusion facilitator CzcD-associated flavoprotein CzcO